MTLEEFAKHYPRSLCTCKHTGDGANSHHAGPLGRGPCFAACGCRKFAWEGWTKHLLMKYPDLAPASKKAP